MADTTIQYENSQQLFSLYLNIHFTFEDIFQMSAKRWRQQRSPLQEPAVDNSSHVLVRVFVLLKNSKFLLISLTRNTVMKYPKFINEKLLNFGWMWEIWGRDVNFTKWRGRSWGENCSVAPGWGRFQLTEGNFCPVALREAVIWNRLDRPLSKDSKGREVILQGWAGCCVRSLPALRCGDSRSYIKWVSPFIKEKRINYHNLE